MSKRYGRRNQNRPPRVQSPGADRRSPDSPGASGGSEDDEFDSAVRAQLAHLEESIEARLEDSAVVAR